MNILNILKLKSYEGGFEFCVSSNVFIRQKSRSASCKDLGYLFTNGYASSKEILPYYAGAAAAVFISVEIRDFIRVDFF